MMPFKNFKENISKGRYEGLYIMVGKTKGTFRIGKATVIVEKED